MNPLLVMALLTAASTGANYAGQKKIDKERAKAMDKAEERRSKKETESRAAAKSTADLLLQAAADEKTKSTELESSYSDTLPPVSVQDPGGTAGALSTLAPVNSTDTIAEETSLRNKSRERGNLEASARAKLNSFGDVMLGNRIQAGRNAQDIAQANTSTSNWNQFVLPQQLQVANAAGNDWKNLADVIQLASMVYGGIGLAKGGAGTVAAKAAGANVAADTAAANAQAIVDQGVRANNNAYWLNKGAGSIWTGIGREVGPLTGLPID